MKSDLQTKIRRIILGLITFSMILFCVNLLNAQVPSPTHHWPLIENLNDVVGGKNGTNFGVTFQNDAIRGPVAYFDGESYARLPQFLNGLTEVTIATWFRMDEVQVWSRFYNFGRGDQTEPKDVMMIVPVNGYGNYRFTLSNPGGPWYDIDFPTETISLDIETWYFSAVVLKPDSIIIYHNNEQVFAEGGFTRQFGTMNDIENALGKSFWPDALWKGALSDLRVYNTALTKKQVLELYNATVGGQTNISDINIENAPKIFGGDRTINIVMTEPYLNEVVYVYNIAGVLVTRKPINEINNTAFNPGVYIVRVLGDTGQHIRKVIVR